MHAKKILSVLIVLMLLLSLVGCGGRRPEVTVTVAEDTKFGSALMAITPEAFAQAGFSLGDSVDISFSNGYSLTDIPFYNGFYVKNNAPVVVAYPGFDNVRITLNNTGIWHAADLSEGDTVTVRLNKVQKYASIQQTLGQAYSFDITQYGSIAQFCNFRALSGGNLKENFLYRGASPVDNSRNRAPHTDRLLEENGIGFVLDLADSGENMQKYLADAAFASPYTAALYASDCVVLLGMSTAYPSDAFRKKVAFGMQRMLGATGPVYIHCTEGKDRTGFVCTLLEALAGASYDEMRADYMQTYANYYGVTASGTPEKYNAIAELYFDAFVACLHGTEDIEVLKSADYTADAVAYLISGGMTAAEAEQLKAFICR